LSTNSAQFVSARKNINKFGTNSTIIVTADGHDENAGRQTILCEDQDKEEMGCEELMLFLYDII
jgi:hypothetical protein